MSSESPEAEKRSDQVARLVPPPVALRGNAVSAIEGQGTVPIAPNVRPPAEPTDPAMDESAKQQFLWHTHQYLGEFSRFGDTKAAFSGAIASALLGALYRAKVHTAVRRIPLHQWTLSTWFAALGGAFLLASVALAIWTVLPRFKMTQLKGFVFWDSIANHGSLESLQAAFRAQSARTLNDQLLHHVFDISTKVCIPKFRTIHFCLWALFMGAFLTVASVVLEDLPDPIPAASTLTTTLSNCASHRTDLTCPQLVAPSIAHYRVKREPGQPQPEVG